MLCQYSRDVYIDLNRKVKVGMRLVELYKPYVFFTGRSVLLILMLNFHSCYHRIQYPLVIRLLFPCNFDDSNTEKLRVAARESDADVHLFDFDPKCIDWEDYIMNTHIPGLIKYS